MFFSFCFALFFNYLFSCNSDAVFCRGKLKIHIRFDLQRLDQVWDEFLCKQSKQGEYILPIKDSDIV